MPSSLALGGGTSQASLFEGICVRLISVSAGL
ncbi:hypothetical protein EMIT093MI4_50314 [Pseudomonas sp. IT-93MI4]